MAVEKIHDRGQTLQTPTGKVLGIADTRADVDKAAKALVDAGFKKVEVLCGDEGVRLLERIDMFFFSDMEDRVLARHLEELKAGHIVIAIETPPNGLTKPQKLPRKMEFVALFISDLWPLRG